MKRFYCTYFDRNYLVKALALIESLNAQEKRDFTLYAVCMDEVTRLVLDKLALPNVETIPIHEIEQRDFPLLDTKKSRTAVEYYWTCTPTIIKRVMERNREIDTLTYVDADLYFFSPPDPIFDELGENSVLIHEHRYSPSLAHLEAQSGRFNVGLMTFRNDKTGNEVLNWWRERCIEWCFKRVENGKMGDQFYLNDWPTRFEGISILQNKGAGVAPWNHIQYTFRTTKAGKVTVDKSPLVFYHYHALHMVTPEVIVPAAFLDYPISEEIIDTCVLPYAEALTRGIQQARTIIPDYSFGLFTDGLLSVNHTFIARKGLTDTLRNGGVTQPVRELDSDWDCYCSDQFQTGSRQVRKRPAAKKKRNYRVSAIVSTYNSEKFIRGCLDDLIAQTLYQKGELEIVVVNTGSEQNEREIVEDYKQRYEHITHVYIPERERMYAAWNRGIKAASGRYITSANTDDRHRFDALEIMANALDSRTDIALVYADCYITTQENGKFGEAPAKCTFTWLEFDPKSLFMACYMGPQPMWRRNLHDKYGYFEPDFVSAGDYEFWLRICKTEQFLHIPETLGLYLESPTSVEHTSGKAAIRETQIALERHWPKEWGPRPKQGIENAVAASRAFQAEKRRATSKEKGHPTLSLCMIVRDEEKFIGQCLESAKDIVDEMIIVDTGSSDRTVDIARSYGANIFEFPWNDNYSDARNESLRHASCDWILVLDADEMLDPGTVNLLRSEIARPRAEGYNLLFQNVITEGSAPDVTVHRVCRLFRNNPAYRYESRIHEHIEECIARSGGRLMPLEAIVQHYGYKPEIVAERGKHEKYVRMLEAEINDRPNDIFYLHHLTSALCAGREFGKAIPYLQHACGIVEPGSSFAPLLFSHLVNALREVGRSEEGLEVVTQAERLGISYPQLSFCKANVLLLLNRPAEALAAFEQAIKLGRGKAWTGDAGTVGYKADFGIATAHLQLGNYAKAAEYALITLKQKPDNVPAMDLLTQVAKATGDEAMLEKYLIELHAHIPGDPKPVICLAELYEKQSRLAEAVQRYSSLVNLGEETATLRVKLGILAEAQGHLSEAEAHYMRAIEIDPNVPNTHNALGLLRTLQGMHQEALDCFATAIERDQSFSDAYFNAGDVLYSVSNYAQAANLYEAGLAHNPSHAPAFLRLGNCYMHSGVPQAAAMAYEQALRINPDYVEAQNNLAMAQEMLTTAHAA